ncbi:MAG: DUF1819 family protein [Chloroflexi bacterium]|nr:DUF1819 family protein [Chloroflexota bacterium]
MIDTIYSMSFTTGTLLYRESILMAELYLDMRIGGWFAALFLLTINCKCVHKTLRDGFKEKSVPRLKLLTPAQLDLLATGSRPEQNHILWLAFCKRYRFVCDFAVEVIREKFLRLDFNLSYADYDIFFQDKAQWHPEVERVAPSTRSKQRQVLFKSLREAEILTDKNLIIPQIMSPRFVRLITEDDPFYLAIFPAR